MSESGLAWTGDQWDRIRQIVHDEALRTRVAASFLPLFGPLAGGTEIIPANTLRMPTAKHPGLGRMTVNDHDSLRLAGVSVNVYLKNHMVSDPELAAATMLFRRAAQVVARVEDAIIFNGRSRPAGEATYAEQQGLVGVAGVPPVYTVSGPGTDEPYGGLVQAARGQADSRPDQPMVRLASVDGPSVFEAVVDAVTQLETAGHYKPYACVLSHSLFKAVNQPLPASMVLPRDSILPFLDGPLLRSSCLEGNVGLLIALQGEPVEIVVPGDISVRYLQTMEDGGHAFRVSQRFRLRVKDASAIVMIGSP